MVGFWSRVGFVTLVVFYAVLDSGWLFWNGFVFDLVVALVVVC